MLSPTPLATRIENLRDLALRLRARASSEALRARIDRALLELERIPESFPEPLAQQALLVPAGRLQTVLEILGLPGHACGSSPSDSSSVQR